MTRGDVVSLYEETLFLDDVDISLMVEVLEFIKAAVISKDLVLILTGTENKKSSSISTSYNKVSLVSKKFIFQPLAVGTNVEIIAGYIHKSLKTNRIVFYFDPEIDLRCYETLESSDEE